MKYKTFFVVGLFFILSYSLLIFNQLSISNIEASNVETYEVSTPVLNVRSSPSSSGEIVGQLTRGNQLIAFEEKYGWVQTYYGGEEVWVAKHLLILLDSSGNQNNSSSTQSNSLEGYNIVIDPGHGGKDPGAIGINNIQEKNLVLSTTRHVIESLESEGATVISTRTSDTFIPLNERVRISDSYYTHAFISLHYDAVPFSSANGITSYIYDNTDRHLGDSLQESIASKVSLNNRGVRQANFKVLRETKAPSVLLELGFITNPRDVSIVQTEGYQNNIAEGISDGLINYFKR